MFICIRLNELEMSGRANKNSNSQYTVGYHLITCCHRRSQDFCLGGATWPTPPSLASVVHTFEAVAGSRGSVSAPAVSRVMQSEIKIAKNIGEMTFGGGFL